MGAFLGSKFSWRLPWRMAAARVRWRRVEASGIGLSGSGEFAKAPEIRMMLSLVR